MVYKSLSELKNRNKNFLRKSSFEASEIKEERKTSIRKLIRNTLLIAASVSMLFFINFSNNANYSNILSAPSISMQQKSKEKFVKFQPLLSSNWSGYVAASSFKNPKPIVESVTGEWKVTNIQYKKHARLNYLLEISPNNTHLLSFRPPNGNGIWIGIGGQFKGDNTLIQTGISSYYSHKLHSIVNYAWYEILPHNAKIIKFNIKPGDEIYAKIKLLNNAQNKWEIKLSNLTENKSFEKIVNYKSSMLSAEWIIERPLAQETITVELPIGNHKTDIPIPINIVSKLDNFGLLKFKSVIARINSTTEPIGLLHHEKIDMYSSKNKLLAAPSKINEYGSGFKIKDTS